MTLGISDQREILHLRDQKLSVRRICDLLHHSPSTVLRVLRGHSTKGEEQQQTRIEKVARAVSLTPEKVRDVLFWYRHVNLLKD